MQNTNKTINHIGIVGPINLPALQSVIDKYDATWPVGLGGVPVNHLIIALINRGYKVSVFSFTPEIKNKKGFEYHQANLSIYLGPSRQRFRDQLVDLYQMERKYIKASIEYAKPDIIHAHWQYEWSLAALDTAIPTLVNCHDSPVHAIKLQRNFFRLFRTYVAWKVLKKSRFVSAVSPYCAQGAKYLANHIVHVIPNFEPEFVFSYYAHRALLAGKPIKIAMINNRFTSLKNVNVGIKAFTIYKKTFPEAELHLFGGGHGEGEKAYQWIVRNNICSKNIHFRGGMPFDTLMRELSGMDIFLHTAIEESFGMVIAEAMAMGIPVVAGKDSGGPAYILENGGGILTDVTDENQVFEALKEISEEQVYQQQSILAYQVAKERFSEKPVVDKYCELYQSILDN